MKSTFSRVLVAVAGAGILLVLSVAFYFLDPLDYRGPRHAIKMAQEAHTLTSKRTNHEEIQKRLVDARGIVEIEGWAANRSNANTYLAVFRIVHNGGHKGFAFEVNTKIGVVRDVFKSRTLIESYGYPVPPESYGGDLLELARRQYPGDKRTDSALIYALGQHAAQSAPEWFEQYPEFFAAYVHLCDSLGETGNRLEMPSPSQFLVEVNMAKEP